MHSNVNCGIMGYPAYAGIDPTILATIATNYRLPRIRGDRPQSKVFKSLTQSATPHTRGSTLDPERVVLAEEGYPAYAGIDRSLLRRVIRHRWLPRIRGDRPAMVSLVQRHQMATPHTRGSTLTTSGLAGSVRGYPAYAGIDRIIVIGAIFAYGLPRIRGDRP